MAIRQTTPKRLREDVHKYIEDDDFEKAVGVLRTGMKATQIVRGTTAEGQRGTRYDEVPDHGTRLTSARLMLEYGLKFMMAQENLLSCGREMVVHSLKRLIIVV